MAVLEKKQVVLVVEGTTAVGPYWPTILKDHLSNLIRSFFDNGSSTSEDNEDEESLNNVEFAVVVFNAACGSFNSPWFSRQSKWTYDVNCVMKWLSTIDFSSDGAFSDAGATAQGLAQALIMFHSSNESPNDHLLQRHCILVAACNPDSSPLLDVAKLFQQLNVSLSAIYASQLPQHRVICNAGKYNLVTGMETVTQSLHHMNLTSSGNSKMKSIAADLGPGYVHVWEGDLYAVVPPGRRFLLTRLHAFMLSAASKFVEDWPSSIEFDFIGPTDVENWIKKFDGKSNVVVFHAMHSDALLSKMHKENFSGVIKLPSQLMVFVLTDNPSRFLGLILSETPEQQEIMLKRWKHHRNLINKRSVEPQTPEQRQENLLETPPTPPEQWQENPCLSYGRNSFTK